MAVIRKIDELGRLVVPAEYRRSLGINEGDEVAMVLVGGAVQVRSTKGLCRLCLENAGTDRPEVGALCDSCVEAIKNA